MNDRGPTLLTIVLGLAFLAQLAAQAWMRTPAYDESVYRGISRNILRTGLPIRDTAPRSLFANSPPLALYSNAGLMAVTGDHLPATRLLSSIVWGGLLVWLVVALSRRCLGRGRSGLVLACLCLMPMLGQEVLHVEVDLPLIVATTGLVLAWIVWADGFAAGSRLKPALVVGLLLAIAGLVKYSALMLGPLLAIDALVLALRRRVPFSRALRDVTAFAAPPVLALLGWHLLALAGDVNLIETFADLFHRVQGKPEAVVKVPLLWYAKVSAIGLNGLVLLLAAAGSVLVVVCRSDPETGPRTRVFLAAALHVVFFALVSAAERKLRYQDPAMPFLAVLAAIPFRNVVWRFRHETIVLVLGAGAALTVHALRSSIPSPATWSPVPIAAGAAALAAWIGIAVLRAERGVTSSRLFLPVLVLALTQAVLMNPLVKGSRLDGFDQARDVALWIARETPEDAVIAGSDPVTVYHADRPASLMTLGRDYRPTLLKNHAALILTDDWIETQPHPDGVREILETRYRLVKRDEDGVRVYVLR